MPPAPKKGGMYCQRTDRRKAEWQGPIQPFKTAKRSGTADPNDPKADKKRSRVAAENATSESGKRKPLAQLWQAPWALAWQGFGLARLWPMHLKCLANAWQWRILLRRHPPHGTGLADIYHIVYYILYMIYHERELSLLEFHHGVSCFSFPG